MGRRHVITHRALTTMASLAAPRASLVVVAGRPKGGKRGASSSSSKRGGGKGRPDGVATDLRPSSVAGVVEDHAHEQFFYDDATQDRIMRLVKNHARPLFLCNPSLAVRAEAAGMDYLLLDRDPRWKSVLPKGKFRQFELSQPRQMRFQYDAVFVDPPFANVELADLRRTVDLLAANETQAKAPVYLAFISDREDAVMDAFHGYGLERKGAALGYHSVKQSTQERIFLYGPRADWTADDS